MLRILQRRRGLAGRLAAALILTLCAFNGVAAQSTDVSFPTPVLNNEISGRIAPRDLGDARLTRHFYIFNGLEGDLFITVESDSLNGDVDLFTAGALRPLAKVTLYAGSTPTRVTRSVYLRNPEPLVLRVEGRSASETDGVYTISFSGAFASATNITPPPGVTPTLSATNTARDRNVRRVTSTGARIEEPAPVVTPRETASETTSPAATPTTEETNREATPRPTTRPAPRASRSTRAARTRTPRGRTPSTSARDSAPAGTATTTGTTANTESSATTPSETTSTRTTNRNSSRTRAPNTRTARSRANTPARGGTTPGGSAANTTPRAVQPVISTRLIIENRDGSKVEHDMNAVRRMTVENNQVVIIMRDGKTERLPMAGVLRVSIEP